MLALALVLALGQTPQHRLFQQPNLPNGVSYAFFEAFPASGAGTTTACSTTAPTGARGEVLTFTRGSNGTCTKTATGGLATTGIADGDLTVLGNNVARVEYDSAGTLGLLVESTRTNSALRSQEFDNASWTKFSFGTGSLPVITADQATAPDGTLTADRVQFSAVDGTSQSGILQAVGITTGTNAVSVYVKGVSGSGSIQLAVYSAASCVTCNYVSTSWSRCTVAGAITASGHIRIGNDPAVCGGGARTAQDVYLWGAQFEAGAYATSYIPTTTIAVARSAETATFSITTPASSQSLAGSRVGPTTATGTFVIAITQTAGPTYGIGLYHQTGARKALLGSTPNIITPGGASTSPTRAWASWDGTTFTADFDGTSTTSTPVPVLASRNSINIGSDNGASQTDGVVSRVCLDPSPTRCR